MTGRRVPTIGVYLSPADILDRGDALRRLVEVGVKQVVLRCGFDPSHPDPRLELAAERVQRAGLSLCLLVGGWWGEGINPGNEAMRCLTDDLLPNVTPDLAHESRWPMHCPLGRWTEVIAGSAASLVQRCQPDAVCLTHARFHHAADVRGLLSIGSDRFVERMAESGLRVEQLRAMLHRLVGQLRQCDPDRIARSAEGHGIDRWLDEIVGEELFSRWFQFRRQVIADAIRVVRSAIDSATGGVVRFGINLLNPLFCPLSGPTPTNLRGVVDFVQPLLGYVRWHVAQPIERLAAWLRSMQPAMTIEHSVETVAAAVGIGDLRTLHELLSPVAGEGRPESLTRLMAWHRERLRDDSIDHSALQVVLRGTDWDASWLREELGRWRDAGFEHVVFQGTDFLLRD